MGHIEADGADSFAINNAAGWIERLSNFNLILNRNGTAIMNFGSIGTLFNQSTIASDSGGSAINNGGWINELENQGLIQTGSTSSQDYAINNQANASILILQNNGAAAIRSLYGTAIFNNNASIFTINNDGVIISNERGMGTGVAIQNTDKGKINTLNNGGTIEAKGSGNSYAISNTDGATIGTINNESLGLIKNANGTAILNSSTISSIINDGIIAGGKDAYAIDNRTGTITNGITNRGLIEGKVDLGTTSPSDVGKATTLYLSGDHGRVAGIIWGGMQSKVVVDGTFTQENEIDVDQLKIQATGKLTLSGHEILADDTENHGLLVLNAGTTGDIHYGTYTQSKDAVLEIGVKGSGAGDYGKLYVGGLVKFEAGTGIHVNVASTNTLANNALLTSVVSSEKVINASTFNLSEESLLFDFVVVLNEKSIDLLTKLASSTKSGIYTATFNQGFTQGLAAARVLDGFVSGSNSGDLATVVDAFGRLGSDQALSQAVAQTLPLMSASMNQVMMNAMDSTNRVIAARQEANMGGSSGDDFMGDKYFWFKPVASRADQGNRHGIAGYRADTYGMIFGADVNVSDRHRLGVAFAYMNNDIDGKANASSNSAEVDAYQIAAYGSHALASHADIFLNWQADAGLNKNDGRRVINFGGLDRVAKSDFDSTTAHVGVGLGQRWHWSERTTFIPSLRADYFRIHNEAYNEKGADALSLHVNSANSEQLIAAMEGRVQHRLTDKAILSLNGDIGYDLLNSDNSITANYVGGGAAFRTQGLELSPWLGHAGVGLAVNATDRAEVSARYDLEGRSDFIAQTASIKIRWAF